MAERIKGKKRRAVLLVAAIVLLAAAFAICMANRLITPLFARGYEVRGVDVSHYQGEIDWQELAAQEISFAYIKATEGTTHTDEYFESNWAQAAETDLLVGAYHFFSFTSPGKNQAEHFIDVVGDISGKLLPAVDVEYYAGVTPDVETVVEELTVFLNTVEKIYGVKPIIYATYASYNDFIKGNFDDYPLWIRNVYFTPNLGMSGKWVIWQYTDVAVLLGYSGEEKYIDMNVFYMGEEELQEFIYTQ